MSLIDVAIRIGPPKIVWRAIAWRNYWRGEAELQLLRRLVDRGRGAVDVGAFKGVYTYHLARLCPRVWAYEPNPRMARFLAAAAGPRIVVRNVAVSDKAGAASLRIPMYGGRPNEGRASLSEAGLGEAESKLEFTVGTTALDREDLVDVGFVKIDVEGYELAVLRGARGLIERERPVLLVEIEQRHLDVPMSEVFRYVEGMGYEGWFYLRGAMHRLEDFDPDEHQCGLRDDVRRPRDYVNNFIFMPRRGGREAIACAECRPRDAHY